jgi:DNA-binding GntR family transcriptional regulator
MSDKPHTSQQQSSNETDNFAEGELPRSNITNLPLANQVASIIRDMIIQDKLKPGERIRERQLSEKLDVSRTPLREAIKILESEKLVESLPNRGAVVSSPEPENIRELLQVLATLEALGGRLAAENATDQQISEIRALHFEMLAAFCREDKLTYFKLNQTIHKSIIAASGNTALVETHDHLNARVYRFRYLSNQRNEKWHEAVDQHEGIVKALEARNGELLEQVMASHLGQTWLKVSEIE